MAVVLGSTDESGNYWKDAVFGLGDSILEIGAVQHEVAEPGVFGLHFRYSFEEHHQAVP